MELTTKGLIWLDENDQALDPQFRKTVDTSLQVLSYKVVKIMSIFRAVPPNTKVYD